jgi:hypothetical protein
LAHLAGPLSQRSRDIFARRADMSDRDHRLLSLQLSLQPLKLLLDMGEVILIVEE